MCVYVNLHINIMYYIHIHAHAYIAVYNKMSSKSFIFASVYPSVYDLVKKFTVPVTDKRNPVLFHTNSCKECNSHIAEGLMAIERRQ